MIFYADIPDRTTEVPMTDREIDEAVHAHAERLEDETEASVDAFFAAQEEALDEGFTPYC